MARKFTSSLLKVSGCSMFRRCEACFMIFIWAPVTFSLISCEAAGGVLGSSFPTNKRVGQRISFKMFSCAKTLIASPQLANPCGGVCLIILRTRV